MTSGLITPQGIALDAAAGKMHWADAVTVKIQRTSLDGAAVEDLVTSGPIIPFGLALDATAGKMYWTDDGADKIRGPTWTGPPWRIW